MKEREGNRKKERNSIKSEGEQWKMGGRISFEI